jgi:hypothetical protein
MRKDQRHWLNLPNFGHQAGSLPQYGTIVSSEHCALQSWRKSMEQVVDTSSGSVAIETPGISWGAVLAGAAAACALTLLLLSLGVGLGFAVVSPWGSRSVSSTSFAIGTGLYFIVMAMISSGLGGYLAGRLRRKSIGLEITEVQFRDTAHGFLAWAVASIIGAVLLASPASSLLGSATGGAAQAAANASQSSPINTYTDMLLRSDNRTDQQSLADTRGEITRLLTTSLRAKDVNGADRDYLVKTVAARTGLSQADAEKRFNDVMTQAKSDLDKARKAAMHTAIWLTLSLFIGAFAAAAAAWEGGGVRDGTWRGVTSRETLARAR